MTLTEYKKAIRSLSREALEDHLFQLFKTNKVFKDIESTTFKPADNQTLLEELKKKLEKVFWKENFSLSECKAVLKDYLSRTTDLSTIALMHLTFASEAIQLSANYGDFGEAFYNAALRSAESFLEYCKGDPAFFEKHEDEFESLVKTADPIGYGVADDLETMLYDVREELYDTEDEE